MNSVKLSNLDNNPLLVEIADEESAAVNGGWVVPVGRFIVTNLARGAVVEAGRRAFNWAWNKITRR